VAVATVSAFIKSALTGSTTDPVISHRIASVTPTSTLKASGRALAIDACWSTNEAAVPPTSTRAGAGIATDPRDGPLGSPRDRIANGAEPDLPGMLPR
jgi:hypothetical protein